MAYIDINTAAYPQTSGTMVYPQTGTIRAEPQSPSALHELAEASKVYAEAAGSYILARDNLADARNRWQTARDVVAKSSEAEGV